MKPFNGNALNVIIETPKGSRNKYTYNPATGFYELAKVLPAGTGFPFDFGFIPGTLSGDGDPLDVMVIAEAEFFPGCLVKCRIIGAVTAEQKEKGKKKERNDRVIAVPIESVSYSMLKDVREMNSDLMKELICFFEYYTGMRGKKFKFLDLKGQADAVLLVKKYTT